ncbi:hypothetical protein [Desulfovibrio sp. Fe33]|uniref:hypothetical protein n=1 Tax=Desulfovibrio sp. Fe33 TaxID=3020842 RepID=UPI00234C5CEA|nr:hypothetical protein [Desulfovibrio sp. Fe33]
MPTENHAAQSPDEILAFIEAFARITVGNIKNSLSTSIKNTHSDLGNQIPLNWTESSILKACGLSAKQVGNDPEQAAERYLHIQTACTTSKYATAIKKHFLKCTGLSKKQQKTLFPQLVAAKPSQDTKAISQEVARLNEWLDWVRVGDFQPENFDVYRQNIKTHGQTQNVSGAIGTAGAVIAFVDAIRHLNPNAIVDSVGEIPPPNVRSPQEISDWRTRIGTTKSITKALLLKNGRSLVFATSKDANIFQSLDRPFTDATEALKKFNKVKNNQSARSQTLHEFAVGEIKTATDLSNLHERMGLASRETQTELRTDRFLMMAVLNREILEGGIQQRKMNSRDLTRFSHTFNLHHCWGWDGGRERHPTHWNFFLDNVKTWCGL